VTKIFILKTSAYCIVIAALSHIDAAKHATRFPHYSVFCYVLFFVLFFPKLMH